MISLGFKRKELHGQPEPCTKEKDWDSEIVEPEVYVEGKQAEAMGAEIVKAGDAFTAEVKFKVKELTKIEENGAVRYRMRLCLSEMGDIETEESDSEDESETEAAPSGDTSPLEAAMEAGD